MKTMSKDAEDDDGDTVVNNEEIKEQMMRTMDVDKGGISKHTTRRRHAVTCGK